MNIPLSKPIFYEEEIDQIRGVLESGWLTQGPKSSELEKNFADYCNAKYALAVNSGTAALHLALMAHNIGKDDEVIVPAITFIATPNSVVTQGAKPVFSEINPKTCNIDIEDVKKKITKKTKAIIPVHLYGNPADMDEIMEIAQKNNLTVIEDAAQAHGAEYKGKKIGSLGNTTCFSFHPMKNMTTGEGGMIVSNNEEVIGKMKILRSHGEIKAAWQRFENQEIKKRKFVEIGYNYRMSDVLAAIGLVQLKHLDENNEKRIELSKLYTEKLAGIKGIELPSVKENTKHVFHMYVIKTEKRDELAHKLLKKGIHTGVYYTPCHLEESYVNGFGYKEGNLPVSEKVGGQILSLPMYPDLKEDEINFITEEIKNSF
jgi:dTDP-4-amino-4,6-dideoxygalactose transaminase